MFNRGVGLRELAAVRKTVWRDVDDPHDRGELAKGKRLSTEFPSGCAVGWRRLGQLNRLIEWSNENGGHRRGVSEVGWCSMRCLTGMMTIPSNDALSDRQLLVVPAQVGIQPDAAMDSRLRGSD